MISGSYSKFSVNVKNFLTYNYIGYFPLGFFNFMAEYSYGFFTKFSTMQYLVGFYSFRFFRRVFQSFIDLDFHISFFLGRGFRRLKGVGLINFYRFLTQEYYFIHGLQKTFGSFVKNHQEIGGSLSTLGFFKKRFFFKKFKDFKSALVLNFFFGLFFYKNYYFNFIIIIFFYFLKKLIRFFIFFFFLNLFGFI